MRIVQQPPAASPPPAAADTAAEEHPTAKIADEHTQAAHPVGSKIKEGVARWLEEAATPSFNEREQRAREEHDYLMHPHATEGNVASVPEEVEPAPEPEEPPASLKDRIAMLQENASPDAFEKKRHAAMEKPEPEPEPEPVVAEEEDEGPLKLHPVSSTIQERMEQWGQVASPSFNEEEHRLRQELELKQRGSLKGADAEETEPELEPEPATAEELEATRKTHSVSNKLKERLEQWGQATSPSFNEEEQQGKKMAVPEKVDITEDTLQKVHPVSNKIKERMEQLGQGSPSFSEDDQEEGKEAPYRVEAIEESKPEVEQPATPNSLKHRIAMLHESASPNAYEKKRLASSPGKPADLPDLEPGKLKNLMATFGKTQPLPELETSEDETKGAVKSPPKETDTLESTKPYVKPSDMPDIGGLLADRVKAFSRQSSSFAPGEEGGETKANESPAKALVLPGKIGAVERNKEVATPSSETPTAESAKPYVKPPDMPDIGGLLKDRVKAFSRQSSSFAPGEQGEAKVNESPEKVSIPPEKNEEVAARSSEAQTVESPKAGQKPYSKPADMPDIGGLLKNRMAAFSERATKPTFEDRLDQADIKAGPIASPAPKTTANLLEGEAPTSPSRVSFKPADMPELRVSLKDRMQAFREGELVDQVEELGAAPQVEPEVTVSSPKAEPKAYAKPSDMPTGVSLRSLMAAYTDKAKPAEDDEYNAQPASAKSTLPEKELPKPAKKPESDVQRTDDEAPPVGTPKVYERPADMPSGVSLKNLLATYTIKAQPAVGDSAVLEPASPKPINIPRGEATAAKADVTESPLMDRPRVYEKPPDMPSGVSLKNLRASYTSKAKVAAPSDDQEPAADTPEQDNAPDVEGNASNLTPKAEPKAYEKPADMPGGVSLKNLMSAYTHEAKVASLAINKDHLGTGGTSAQ